MRPIKRKALAYVTHGGRLLIFSHPAAPEAGLQVPAGTVEDGERPEEAVLREAREETGRSDLRMARFLGEQVRDVTAATILREWRHHAADGAGDA